MSSTDTVEVEVGADDGAEVEDVGGFTWLHGDLDLEIIRALNLPNMDVVVHHARRCFTACDTIKVPCFKAKPGVDDEDADDDRKVHLDRQVLASDPYVQVVVPHATLACTRVIRNSPNPQWEEKFYIPLAHQVNDLEFLVKDDDIFGANLIGTVKVPAQGIAAGAPIDGLFTVLGPYCKRGTKLQLKMKFTPVEKNPLYSKCIAGDPEHQGVRNAYFPLRKCCSVTLYQDAHVPDRMLPEIELDGSKVYQQQKCWEDICVAILEAHHLVYVVGWSIYHKVKLVRESTLSLPDGTSTLGDLLKYKSQEGVRVLLLLWDDGTSRSEYFGLKGVMQTHDEETKKFFSHSSVKCVLAPRYASSKMGYFKQKVVGSFFTHHQKCVLVDTQAGVNSRKITAFLGGIDLCDGRYDTPQHRLFRDLDTVFQDDFHNPTFPAGTKFPRQPWHDLHCKVDGPAAYDVLINFEQRWLKATKWNQIRLWLKRVSHSQDDSLIRIERVSWIRSPPPYFSKKGITSVPKEDTMLRVCREEDPENWHVQILRSIDSGSVKKFPKKPSDAVGQNLIHAKSLRIDKSIQTGYIQAIRSAQHFIYIENQYFIGSSYAWSSYKDAGADNLIPMELALKIASKIKANERFAVYVVIPMWPEGDPTSATVQEILFWQSQTIQMMYDIVARELRPAASDPQENLHPQDYLNFYCLGKREDSMERLSDNADEGSDAQRHKRFMIYVHAKGLIVDDEYVIVGSANINQRSMAGTKDTEIAMGAYQPHHTRATGKKQPRGQVYGYRMSLWGEHLGMDKSTDTWFNEPESLQCVRKVKEIARENWKRYTDESSTELRGHLLEYPIQVGADGKVSPLPGYENFPDVGGKVLGSPSPALPDILTT